MWLLHPLQFGSKLSLSITIILWLIALTFLDEQFKAFFFFKLLQLKLRVLRLCFGKRTTTKKHYNVVLNILFWGHSNFSILQCLHLYSRAPDLGLGENNWALHSWVLLCSTSRSLTLQGPAQPRASHLLHTHFSIWVWLYCWSLSWMFPRMLSSSWALACPCGICREC